ncbi:hypothetical protein LTR37_000413 [Vermiconidia calcicola]|uniref:Uncharacterized protein n=1 Tax=Vermiconidia calcicola TaxID=1690605 RepID=A0ACC3NYU1_9PEZI|nr:hypothetical protein LTR37_000413 [Vermiconidia calcicola]
MAMHPHFKYGRLHVGFRAKDWKDVWFEPKKPKKNSDESAESDEEDDGNGKKKKEKIFYYMSPRGKDIWRAPDPSEIHWHSFYDINLCEAKGLRTKQKLQWEYLTDAHSYLIEKDQVMVQALEAKLDQPSFSRWQAFFVHAKKWKKRDMRARQAKRAERTQTARDAGANDAEVAEQVNSDPSDDDDDDSDADSTYQSVAGLAPGRAASTSMAPPPPKRPGGKRKTPGNGADTRRPSAKKVKSEHNSQTRLQYNRNQLSPSVVNGVMGSLRGSIPERPDSIADEEDHESETFDTRPPPEMPDFGHEADDMQYHGQSQRRRRGGSRSEMTPVEQWAGADQIQEEIGFEEQLDGVNASNADDDAESGIVRAWRDAINGVGLNDDEAFQQAVRASLPPADHSRRGSVVPSIEPRDTSNGGNNRGDDSAA